MKKIDLIQKLKHLDGITQDERAFLINLVNTKKKYGLVWEDKPEDVEEQLRENLPILKEVKDKTIINGEDIPNHILIEGDNFHALTALTFTHEGKIDVIYIDPPYNTGNRDFIYNDEYVDKEDGFRHSKWISFMHKRLKIASALLSDNGIIAISIGYQEVNNLVLLCEELFSHKQVVCVTVQTSGGKPSGGFNYLQEYIIFITPYDFEPNPLSFAGGVDRSPYEGLTLSTFDKIQRPNQTYPIFIDINTGNIVGTGKSLASRVKEGIYKDELAVFPFDYSEAPDGAVALWPITSKGKECVWRLIPGRLMKDWQNGYIKVSPNVSTKNPNKYSVQYLPDGVIKKIKNGELIAVGTEEDRPTLVFGENKTVGSDIPTIWLEKSFFTTKGSNLLKEIIKDSKFSYPKPIELIGEILRAISKPNSLVLDFFAGSGSTLHATMLLNAEDDGNRRCILVTNNENNICEEITFERSKKVIHGYSKANGEQIEGLPNNNLRYYKNEFVSREPTVKNKKEITRLATGLLCIKEDIYTEQRKIGGYQLNTTYARCFKQDHLYLLAIYDEEVIEQMVEVIQNIVVVDSERKTHFKIYVFSNGQYPYTEEFEDVLPFVTLCALPDAIYKAYQNILPKRKRMTIPDLEESTAEDVETSLYNDSEPNLFKQA
jgi:adenine-specific DNA-methyltransferase